MAKRRVISAFLSVLFAGVIVLSAGYSRAVPKKQITVVFRCDDYCTRSSSAIEERLMDTFKDRGIAFTVGVIPAVCEKDFHDEAEQDLLLLSPSKCAVLQEGVKQKVIDVALHGYSHQTVRKDEDGGYSEFDGIKYQEQVKRIKSGKELLEKMLGVDLLTFIPPWGSCDDNTVLALESAGFVGLSPDVKVNIKDKTTLKILPETCILSDLKDAVSSARGVSDPSPIIVVYFHWNTFFETNQDRGELSYKEFEDILDWVIAQEDVKIMTIDKVFLSRNDLGGRRFLEYQRYLSSFDLLPEWIHPPESKIYFYPQNGYSGQTLFFGFITFVFYVLVTTVSAVIVFYLIRRFLPRPKNYGLMCKYGMMTVLVLTAVYAFKNSDIGIKGMLTLSIVLGATFGSRKCIQE